MNALQVELGVAVRRDPKVLRRVYQILIIVRAGRIKKYHSRWYF
jgi:hypothetical protein